LEEEFAEKDKAEDLLWASSKAASIFCE
jgi:hypothetical protein